MFRRVGFAAATSFSSGVILPGIFLSGIQPRLRCVILYGVIVHELVSFMDLPGLGLAGVEIFPREMRETLTVCHASCLMAMKQP
jgi:hypothetical protein